MSALSTMLPRKWICRTHLVGYVPFVGRFLSYDASEGRCSGSTTRSHAWCPFAHRKHFLLAARDHNAIAGRNQARHSHQLAPWRRTEERRKQTQRDRKVRVGGIHEVRYRSMYVASSIFSSSIFSSCLEFVLAGTWLVHLKFLLAVGYLIVRPGLPLLQVIARCEISLTRNDLASWLA